MVHDLAAVTQLSHYASIHLLAWKDNWLSFEHMVRNALTVLFHSLTVVPLKTDGEKETQG